MEPLSSTALPTCRLAVQCLQTHTAPTSTIYSAGKAKLPDYILSWTSKRCFQNSLYITGPVNITELHPLLRWPITMYYFFASASKFRSVTNLCSVPSNYRLQYPSQAYPSHHQLLIILLSSATLMPLPLSQVYLRAGNTHFAPHITSSAKRVGSSSTYPSAGRVRRNSAGRAADG
jgi:hypothetical protein